MRLWPLVIVVVLRRLGPQVFGSSEEAVVMELPGSRLLPLPYLYWRVALKHWRTGGA